MDDGLTLEKLRIDERLREVEKTMAEAKPVRDEIVRSLNRLEKSVESISYSINGNSETGVDGLEKRLYRIEESEQSRKKSIEAIIKLAIGALTMSVGAAIMWVLKVVKTAFISG